MSLSISPSAGTLSHADLLKTFNKKSLAPVQSSVLDKSNPLEYRGPKDVSETLANSPSAVGKKSLSTGQKLLSVGAGIGVGLAVTSAFGVIPGAAAGGLVAGTISASFKGKKFGDALLNGLKTGAIAGAAGAAYTGIKNAATGRGFNLKGGLDGGLEFATDFSRPAPQVETPVLRLNPDDMKIPETEIRSDLLPKAKLSEMPEMVERPVNKAILTVADAELPTLDDLSFGDAFAQSRADGAATFEWRGNLYTTDLAPNPVVNSAASEICLDDPFSAYNPVGSPTSVARPTGNQWFDDVHNGVDLSSQALNAAAEGYEKAGDLVKSSRLSSHAGRIGVVGDGMTLYEGVTQLRDGNYQDGLRNTAEGAIGVTGYLAKKAVPGASATFGAIDAYHDYNDGKYMRAGLNMISGVAGEFKGPGTLVSLGVDGLIWAADRWYY